MRRFFYIIFGIFCILLSGLVTVQRAEADSGGVVQIPVTGIIDYDASYQALEKINEARKVAGLSPLTMDESSLQAAVARAEEVLLYYDHTRPNGESCFSGFSVAGTLRAENIAISTSEAPGMVNAWLASAHHKANILNESYKSTGIGCFYQPDGKKAWVQIFSDAEATEVTKSGKETASVTIEALTDYVLSELYGNETMELNQSSALELKLYNVGGGAVRITMDPSCLTFSSSVPEVASVSAEGVITAHSSGVTTIQAYVTAYPQIQARIAVEVKEKPQLLVTPAAVRFQYDGTEKKCMVEVADPVTLKILEEGTDYSVAFSNNIDAGTMRIRVDGLGSYAEQYGLATATIRSRPISSCQLSYTLAEGNEDAEVVLYDPALNKTLVYGVDYGYSVTKEEQSVTLTVYGCRNYDGTLQETKSLTESEPDTPPVTPKPAEKPKKVKITKAVSGKKWILLRWEKGTDLAGYQLQISTSRKFTKNCKTVEISANKNKLRLKKLKKATKYYIRIQAFCKNQEELLYSGWSDVKKLRTKK